MPAAASLGRSQGDRGPAGRSGAPPPNRRITAGGRSNERIGEHGAFSALVAASLFARGAEDLEAITPEVGHEKARVRRRRTGRRDRGFGRELINHKRWGFPRRGLFRII